MSVLGVMCIVVGLGQSLILQVAKKASVLKRRKSRNRMEVNSGAGTPQGNAAPPPLAPPSQSQSQSAPHAPPERCDSEADVVFYMDEPKTGAGDMAAPGPVTGNTPGPGSGRIRRGERESARGAFFVSQTSSVTEAASDEIDCDLDVEPPRVTQLVFTLNFFF